MDLICHALSSFLLFFTFLRIFIAFAATRLGLPLLIINFFYVLWHLTQGCYLPAQRRASNVSLASEMLQQSDTIIRKTFRISLLLSETSNQLSANRFSGFNRDELALSVIFMRTFCASLQKVYDIHFSTGSTSGSEVHTEKRCSLPHLFCLPLPASGLQQAKTLTKSILDHFQTSFCFS